MGSFVNSKTPHCFLSRHLAFFLSFCPIKIQHLIWHLAFCIEKERVKVIDSVYPSMILFFVSLFKEWIDHMKQFHMEYCEGYRICRHCGQCIGLKALNQGKHLTNSVLNYKMTAHLITHDPNPKPKTKLCPECGEGFSVSYMKDSGKKLTLWPMYKFSVVIFALIRN